MKKKDGEGMRGFACWAGCWAAAPGWPSLVYFSLFFCSISFPYFLFPVWFV
jgi:hypothetical protein